MWTSTSWAPDVRSVEVVNAAAFMTNLFTQNMDICLSGALVDTFGEYKYLYLTCGVLMLAPGLFFFIMHYFNYKKLKEEQKPEAAVETRRPEETVELKTNDEASK